MELANVMVLCVVYVPMQKRKHGGYVVTLKKNGDILFIRDQKSKISECIVNNEDYFNNKSKSCNTFCPMFV